MDEIRKEVKMNQGEADVRAMETDLPSCTREKCEKIIHAAAVACGGVGTGFAQIPLADSAIITPIQIAMIVNIGKEYDMEVTDSMATAIIGSLSGAVIGRSVSEVLFGWVPVIGNIVNTATAAGLTEAIGHLTVMRFEEEYTKRHTKIRAGRVLIA